MEWGDTDRERLTECRNPFIIQVCSHRGPGKLAVVLVLRRLKREPLRFFFALLAIMLSSLVEICLNLLV